MTYKTVIHTTFPLGPAAVYRALTDLSRYPLWNSGMVTISEHGRMRPGLRFSTTSVVLGRENRSEVEVIELTENREIVLKSDTGMITFTARYELESDKGMTQVSCLLDFELTGIALNFAHPVIESMARARITGDLETLKALLDSQDYVE